MCSVGDDFENDGEKHMPSISKIKIDNLKCNKCKEESPIIMLRHKDAYCKNCFITGTNHKFKAVLGKSKLIRPNDRVMVSYEVGHPSTALMHLLRSGLDLNTPKKLRFKPVLLFIEDQFHLTVKERQEMINKIGREAEYFQFQIHLISLANSLTNDDINIAQNNLNLNEDDEEQINRIFNKKTNNTTRREIINIINDSALQKIDL